MTKARALEAAARIREMAAKEKDPIEKAQLEEIAARWDLLAQYYAAKEKAADSK
ncbi:MAG: hypothetical protein RLZZ416_162 [Candidatus Parcubacteria bacterium]|jgi:hypothetical protein